MPDSRDTDTPTPASGIPVGGRHRAEQWDGYDMRQFNARPTWGNLCVLLVVVTTSVAGTTVTAFRAAWAVPIGIGQAVMAIIGISIVAWPSVTSANRLRRQSATVAPESLPHGSPDVSTEPTPNTYAITTAPSRTNTSTYQRDVSVTVGKRLRLLIQRAVNEVDAIEKAYEDPELLGQLYHLDHLIVLALRQADNVAVLSGDTLPRHSDAAVDIHDIVLAAVQEIEKYNRVAIVPTDPLRVHGRCARELAHMLTELIENATNATNPEGPKVEVRAQRVTAGLAVEVQDRGLGIPVDRLHRFNQLLTGQVDDILPGLVGNGHIGLAVVRVLARRHEVRVQLQKNVYGGVTAAVVVPLSLLVGQEGQSPLPSADDIGVSSQPYQPGQPSRPRPLGSAAIPDADVGMRDARSEPTPLPSPQPPESATSNTVGEHAGRRRPATAQEWPLARDERLATEPSVVAQPRPHDGEGARERPRRLPRATQTGPMSGHPADTRSDATPLASNLFTASAPPLPRRSGSVLPPEIARPPQSSAAAPGHNADLLSQVSRGRRHGMADQEDTEAGTQDRSPRSTTT